ncbi:MAG: UPF0158 family protein, partial [Acidobacteriota bacterium]|nr:UPF0158 family protein [Acidobacteriota bacterium]
SSTSKRLFWTAKPAGLKPCRSIFYGKRRSAPTTRRRTFRHGKSPEWEIARQIAFNRRFEKLPTKFDVHEWAIMQDFSHSVESVGIRDELLSEIHRAGAFRNFKNALRGHRIEAAWFAFRAEALRQIALDWCEAKRVAAK